MRRIAIAFVIGALALGCGGGDESATDTASKLIKDAGDAAGKAADDVAAGAQDAAKGAKDLAGDAAAGAKQMAGDAVEAVASQEVLDCLSTVASGEFSSAVEVCQKALLADPENSKVAAALETAKEGLAAAGSAIGDAGDAVKDAGDAAADRINDTH